MYRTVVRCLVVVAAFSLFLIPAPTAYADSYEVTAKVPAPLPPDLPVITSTDNTQSTEPTTVINGTCIIVVPDLIVVLERDYQTIGSGLCSDQGTFSIVVPLVKGVNIIRVKFMTITGEIGLYGTPITITYVPLETITPPGGTGSAPLTSATKDLGLGLDYDFVTYTTRQETKIKISVSGGVGPYKVTIRWGDGSYKVIRLDGPDTFLVGHLYRSGTDGQMKLLVQVEDASGAKTEAQRALVSFEKIPGSPASAPVKQNDYKVFGIWFTATVGVMLLATLSYSRHLLPGIVHASAKAKRLPTKKTRLIKRGKK